MAGRIRSSHDAAFSLRRGGRLAMAWLMVVALAGCSGTDGSTGPIAWWHRLEGGAIAQRRAPPPGVTDPYPNLAHIPARPSAVDVATRQRIGTGLELDRVEAAQQAADNPLIQMAAPAPMPAPPASTDGQAATAQVAAADAPPASPAPAALPGPAALPEPGATPAAATPATAGAVADAPPPVLPDAPPVPPRLDGLVIPLPPPLPAPPPRPTASLRLAESVIVAFPLGSASLPLQASASLRALAARRHGAPVAVQAHGEAASSDPSAQAQAMALSLQRARAMADVLVSAGVPSAQLRIEAQALGRGGAVRLLD